MKKRLLCFILFSALCVAFTLGAVFNGIFGVVSPVLEVKGDYVAAAAKGDTLYGAQASGEVRELGSGDAIAVLPSRPLYLEFVHDDLYAVCENRFVYKVSGGEIVASCEMIYRPTAMCVTGGRIYVGGTLASDRNRLYAFDRASLKMIDLTTSVPNAEKGENEDYDVWLEREYTIPFDAPIVGVHSGMGKITAVTAYGTVERYDTTGTRTARKGTQYNFAYANFAEDGSIVIADDNGGVLGFTADLTPLEYRHISDDTLMGIAAVDNGALVISRTGTLYRLDENLNEDWHVDFDVKTAGLFATADKVLPLASAGEIYCYELDGLQRMFWMNFLQVVLITGAVILAVVAVFSALCLFAHSAYVAAMRAILRVLKKMFASRKCYLLLLPTIAIALVFAYYPAIKGFILAFFDVELGGVDVFNGFDNFAAMIHNSYFWSGIVNMLIFLVTDIIKGLVPAFIFAELIIVMRSGKAQYATRVLLYLPGIIPGVATLLIWSTGIFGMDGLVNSIVSLFGGTPRPWLGQQGTAMTSLVLFGFPWVGSYIILYGALKGIPPSYYEAAKLDGCSWWRRLIKIDLPLITPQLKYIFVTCFIGSVQDFQRVYMTTEGAHGTYIPMLELYYNLTLFNNLGVAAAMGLLLFAVLMVATLINLKLKTVDSFD